jgi:hypothetical protein
MNERLRQRVAGRARGFCEYCRCPDAFSPSPFSAEHIHPQSLGGSDNSSNLAWSCMGCNLYKAVAIEAVDPATGNLAPLYHPRRQVWNHHFAWSDDLLILYGLTPIGRATISRLQLNRPEVMNLRDVLREAELHPAQLIEDDTE